MALSYGFWDDAANQQLNDANLNKCLLGYGPYGDFPAAAAGNKGMMALATDRNIIYYSDGSAWQPSAFCTPPSIADGDTFYFESNTFKRLAKSTDGKVLTLSGGVPSWGTAIYNGPSTQSDVTGSRAIDGTVYQNTTGKPMTVKVLISLGDSGSGAYAIANSDSSNPPTTVVDKQGKVTGAQDHDLYMSLTFTVLPGNYYKVTGTGNPTLTNWIEWY